MYQLSEQLCVMETNDWWVIENEIKHFMIDIYMIYHSLHIYQKFLFVHTLSPSSPFFVFSPSCPFLIPVFLSLTNTVTFLQNLGLVCLQSITLILEDDFNKQVTLSRGGQIVTSPNQGFTLNGKKQCSEYLSANSKTNPRRHFHLGWWCNISWVPVPLCQIHWRPQSLLLFSSGLEFAPANRYLQ